VRLFKALADDKFRQIPLGGGVYFVRVDKSFKPHFINPGTGGYFRGRDPDVSVKTLNDNWVDGAKILYIGKSNDLRQRIRQYVAFGSGRPAPHRGGRYIWQIKDAMNILSVYWVDDPNPRGREQTEIKKFKNKYGRRPFANLLG